MTVGRSIMDNTEFINYTKNPDSQNQLKDFGNLTKAEMDNMDDLL